MWISKDILPSKTYRTIPPWLQNPTLMLLAHEWNGISNPFSKCLSQLQQKKIASSISFWPLNLSFANTILFRWNQIHQVKAVHHICHYWEIIPLRYPWQCWRKWSLGDFGKTASIFSQVNDSHQRGNILSQLKNKWDLLLIRSAERAQDIIQVHILPSQINLCW